MVVMARGVCRDYKDDGDQFIVQMTRKELNQLSNNSQLPISIGLTLTIDKLFYDHHKLINSSYAVKQIKEVCKQILSGLEIINLIEKDPSGDSLPLTGD